MYSSFSTESNQYGIYHDKELIREMAKNCRNEKFENLKIVCPDGELRLNHLIAFLILPELGPGVDTYQGEGVIMLPEFRMQDIHERLKVFFESVTSRIDQNIQLNEIQTSLFFKENSNIDKIINEEVMRDIDRTIDEAEMGIFPDTPFNLPDVATPPPQMSPTSSNQLIGSDFQCEPHQDTPDLQCDTAAPTNTQDLQCDFVVSGAYTVNQLPPQQAQCEPMGSTLPVQCDSVDAISFACDMAKNKACIDEPKSYGGEEASKMGSDVVIPEPKMSLEVVVSEPKMSSDVVVPEQPKKSPKVPEPSVVQCNDCQQTFTKKCSLQRHILSKHNDERVVCPVCDKLIRKDNIYAHRRLHQEKSLKCDECDRMFVRPSELKMHIKQHTSTKNPECRVCGKAFACQSLLNRHIKIHETRGHICDECDKGFTSAVKLKRHMQSHEGNKHLKCTLCKSAFNRKDNLKKHLKRMHKLDVPDLRSWSGWKALSVNGLPQAVAADKMALPALTAADDLPSPGMTAGVPRAVTVVSNSKSNNLETDPTFLANLSTTTAYSFPAAATQPATVAASKPATLSSPKAVSCLPSVMSVTLSTANTALYDSSLTAGTVAAARPPAVNPDDCIKIPASSSVFQSVDKLQVNQFSYSPAAMTASIIPAGISTEAVSLGQVGKFRDNEEPSLSSRLIASLAPTNRSHQNSASQLIRLTEANRKGSQPGFGGGVTSVNLTPRRLPTFQELTGAAGASAREDGGGQAESFRPFSN